MPHDYYTRVVSESIGAKLGLPDSYAAGIVFTPKSDVAVDSIKEIFAAQAAQRGLRVIGWRSLATGVILVITFHTPLYFNTMYINRQCCFGCDV